MSQEWISDLVFDSKDSDVELRVEVVLSDKQLILPAHSFVLRRISNVFRTMLEEGKFKESQTRIVELKVLGNEKDAMALYTYIYKQELLDLDLHGYLALLHLYQVSSLVNVCEERMKMKLCPYSVSGIAGLVKTISSELYEICLQLMLRSAFLIFSNNLHVCLNEDIMKDLLKADNLNVLKEDQAVEAVWIWEKMFTAAQLGKEVSSQKTGTLLDLIRWSLVSNSNEAAPWFQVATARKGAFQEKVNGRTSVPTPSLLPFCRKCFLKNDLKNDDVILYNGGWLDLLIFTANRNILLSGFVLQAATSPIFHRKQYEYKPFRVNVNDHQVTENIFFAPEYLGQEDDNHFWYLMRFEFRTPVIINSSCINVLRIFDGNFSNNANARCLKKLHKISRHDRRLESPGEDLSFYSDVTGVREIFYF